MDATRAVQERLRSTPPFVMDMLIAVAVVASDLSFVFGVDPELLAQGLGMPPAARSLSVALVLLAAAPLPWRRRVPTVVLALSFAVSLAGLPLGAVTTDLATAVAFYTVAAHVPRPRSLVVCAAASGAVVASLLAFDHSRWVVSSVVFLVATWALGDRQQTRRLATAALEARAERAEAERDRNTRLAASEERARIARELHDVLAHSVSVMVVQATAARRTLRAEPDVAEEALAAVEQTGRQSLTELRGLLGLLREADASPDLAPQPGLARAQDLVERFREAGLPVRAEVTGVARPLAPGVDLSGYRILQEALTNALKHAAPQEVAVRLRYADDAVTIEVVDNGVGGEPTAGDGHGLVGMRERAALVGGSVLAGPRAGGGFRVAATLPTTAAT